MDYKDLQRGQSQDNFWFRGKRGMIDVQMSSLGRKNLKILNIGAGVGEDLQVIHKFGEIYAVDIEKKALDMIPAGLCKEKKKADARKLPYKNNSFDVVVAFDVLEHIPDDWRVVSEVHRVLKKGGNFIFSVPAFQALYSAHDKSLGHQRRYSKAGLKSILEKFKSTEVNYWNCFLFPFLALVRISRKNSKPGVDSGNSTEIVDNILYSFLKFENFLIKKGVSLPFGMSIIGKAMK